MKYLEIGDKVDQKLLCPCYFCWN